jgi:hypothetical protein
MTSNCHERVMCFSTMAYVLKRPNTPALKWYLHYQTGLRKTGNLQSWKSSYTQALKNRRTGELIVKARKLMETKFVLRSLHAFSYIDYEKNLSSSSSSLARQPYAGLGFPQKLLPAKVSGYCFFRFRDKSIIQGGLSTPRPNPGYPGGPMFVSLSWLVPVLKRQDLACYPCMT